MEIRRRKKQRIEGEGGKQENKHKKPAEKDYQKPKKQRIQEGEEGLCLYIL